jgi:hypothetical protein
VIGVDKLMHKCLEIGQARPMHTGECIGGADKGSCTGQIKRWYYDEQDFTCKEFTYSGLAILTI